MTPHREWFSEYERYNGDVFLCDDNPTKIIGRGRVKLLLNVGRIKTLPGVLHIPGLAKNLISVSKMVDAGVKTVIKKYKCKMVQGAMVLMRGVYYGTHGTIYWEEQSLMGVTTLLFSRVKMKKVMSLM